MKRQEIQGTVSVDRQTDLHVSRVVIIVQSRDDCLAVENSGICILSCSQIEFLVIAPCDFREARFDLTESFVELRNVAIFIIVRQIEIRTKIPVGTVLLASLNSELGTVVDRRDAGEGVQEHDDICHMRFVVQL